MARPRDQKRKEGGEGGKAYSPVRFIALGGSRGRGGTFRGVLLRRPAAGKKGGKRREKKKKDGEGKKRKAGLPENPTSDSVNIPKLRLQQPKGKEEKGEREIGREGIGRTQRVKKKKTPQNQQFLKKPRQDERREEKRGDRFTC